MIALAPGHVYQGNGSSIAADVTLSAAIDAALGNTQGGILTRQASSWVYLAPGTAGQFLQTAGAGANALWATAAGGSGTPANPTGTAGDVAVNGSASTYMRSDAAPAVQKGTNAAFGVVKGDGVSISCVTGVCSTTAANSTKVANYTVAAADMGGQVNYNGTSITATIPAISSTVFAAGMSLVITNTNATDLTLASTPTLNGFSGTLIPQNGGILCTSNGTSLDCVALGARKATTATVASGTSALGTSAISSAACATVVTTTATGVATTDVLSWGFNGDPTAVTGYVPAVAGMLTIIAYPSAGNANFKICNNTNASVTPGAITLNWRVVR